MKSSIVIAALVATAVGTASARDLEEMARDGYGAAEQTQVTGEFQGCEFNKKIPFTDGLIFECHTYSYHYAYMPEVLIMKSVRDGSIRVVIDGEEFDGQLFRGN